MQLGQHMCARPWTATHMGSRRACRQPRLQRRPCVAVSGEAASTSTDAFTSCEKAAAVLSDPQQQQQWVACRRLLEDLEFSTADADKMVARAFGWGLQAYWRGAKVEEPPSEEQVLQALDFLKSQLGLQAPDVKKVVKAFPEVVACDVASQLQANMEKLEKDWKLTGQVAARAVVRSPAVLGYNVDCEGTCIGECNRCWARF